jgi:hypothetical protein
MTAIWFCCACAHVDTVCKVFEALVAIHGIVWVPGLSKPALIEGHAGRSCRTTGLLPRHLRVVACIAATVSGQTLHIFLMYT